MIYDRFVTIQLSYAEMFWLIHRARATGGTPISEIHTMIAREMRRDVARAEREREAKKVAA